MKKKLIIIFASVFILFLILFIFYFNSDYRINRHLSNLSGTVNLAKTTFNANFEYKNGKLLSKIDSNTVDSRKFEKFSTFINKETELLHLTCTDKDGFPIFSVSYHEHDVIVLKDVLKAAKSLEMSKDNIFRMQGYVINSKKVLIKE